MKWIKPFALLTMPIILLVCSPVIYNMILHRYDPINAFMRTIANADETTWAPGFTETKFSRVKKGMTQPQVLQVLGEPVRKWNRDYPDTAWSYSWSSGSFDRRDITFSQDGRVTGVHRSFYID